MSSLQPFITVIQTTVEDILKAKGMTLVQKKAFAATIITNLVKTHTHLTDEEKALVNLIIPFLFSEAEVAERCVNSGCFLPFKKCFKRFKKNTNATILLPEISTDEVQLPVVPTDDNADKANIVIV